MVMESASRVAIDGVEIRRAGQAGVQARYPLHWHLAGETTGQVARSAIWDSSQRCIVVHGTSGLALTDNVCHDIKGHAVFLEDGNERRNLLERNLVLGVRTPAKPLKRHDRPDFQRGPAGFWLSNPDNTVRGNVAADAQGNGFWLAFARKPQGDAAKLALLPDRLPFGVFDDNVAHSNGQFGINLDWAPTDDEGRTPRTSTCRQPTAARTATTTRSAPHCAAMSSGRIWTAAYGTASAGPITASGSAPTTPACTSPVPATTA